MGGERGRKEGIPPGIFARVRKRLRFVEVGLFPIWESTKSEKVARFVRVAGTRILVLIRLFWIWEGFRRALGMIVRFLIFVKL